MDNAFLQKCLKLAIAAPLAYSAALVSDISAGSSFLGPLMVFIILFYLSGSIAQKEKAILGMWQVLAFALFVGAFVAGTGWANSVTIFLSILLLGLIVQLLIPRPLQLAMLPLAGYNVITVLAASTPYTAAVENTLLLTLGLLSGWLAERFFWAVREEQALEQQAQQTVQLLNQLRDLAFSGTYSNSAPSEAATVFAVQTQIATSIQGTKKTLKSAITSGRLTPESKTVWQTVISLQARLQAELIALARLFYENQTNPLLQEFRAELIEIDRSSEAVFGRLRTAVIQRARVVSGTPLDLESWQHRLAQLRASGRTQSFDLAARLQVALIEHRLEGLARELADCQDWLLSYRQISQTSVRPPSSSTTYKPAES
ncbi:MAG: hypothetical protein AAGG02_05765 [Cyanobacteria bacterium P01_H01_bin.15]